MVGSLICAQADSLMPMLLGRAFQGLAAGFIPVGISLMREITPPHMTTTAISAMSATLGVGGAIGLPLAAWVAQDFDWHALFWMSAGLALLVSIGVALVVPHVHDATGGRFDVIGALGLAAGLVATLVAISKGNSWGWDSPRRSGSWSAACSCCWSGAGTSSGSPTRSATSGSPPRRRSCSPTWRRSRSGSG